jgi:hypothetical protein
MGWLKEVKKLAEHFLVKIWGGFRLETPEV